MSEGRPRAILGQPEDYLSITGIIGKHQKILPAKGVMGEQDKLYLLPTFAWARR